MANGTARRGSAKYDEQVWAGLVDDPRRHAELAQARVPAKLGPQGHAQGAALQATAKVPDVTAENLQSP